MQGSAGWGAKVLDKSPRQLLYKLEKNLLKEMNTILIEEEVYGRQQSQVQWFANGERN